LAEVVDREPGSRATPAFKGVVVLDAKIDATGRVIDGRVLRSIAPLDGRRSKRSGSGDARAPSTTIARWRW
jgi:hypothetical protein